eukprot:13000856-Alexandrium_andersonii.AAC.1
MASDLELREAKPPVAKRHVEKGHSGWAGGGGVAEPLEDALTQDLVHSPGGSEDVGAVPCLEHVAVA